MYPTMIPLQDAAPSTGQVKAVVSRRPGADPLDALLGPHYVAQYAPRGLRMALTPHSLTLVVVSRYYPTESVVVDFEDPKRPFLPEEKRRWFHTQGIAYVAVYQKERLTPAEFQARLEAERTALHPPTLPAPVFDSSEHFADTGDMVPVEVTPAPATDDVQALAAVAHATVGEVLADPTVREAILTRAAALVPDRAKGVTRVTAQERRARLLTTTIESRMLLGQTPITVESARVWVENATEEDIHVDR
jgi:hypothetical protein